MRDFIAFFFQVAIWTTIGLFVVALLFIALGLSHQQA